MQSEIAGTEGLSRKVRLADWLGRYALPPLSLVALLSGGFLTFNWIQFGVDHPGIAALVNMARVWDPVVFIICATLSFIVSGLQSLCRPTLYKLQQKVDLVGESFRTLCDGLMADLAAKLAIRPGDASRASLYVHDRKSSFVLCGRYAPDPVFRRPGRPAYPDNQGCISNGWRNGWCFENNLGEGDDYARNTTDRYGISPEDLVKIPMQSTLFGVRRIDFGSEPLALVVVESMRQDRFDDPSLEAELGQFAADYAPIINSFREYVPTPGAAKARGF